MRGRVLVFAAGALLAVGLAGVPGASAAVAPAPGFRIGSIATPTNFLASEDNSCNKLNEPGERSCDGYLLTVTNSGGAPTDGTPITIVDALPNGLAAEGVFSKVNGGAGERELSCAGGPLVRCVFGGVLKPDEVIQVKIFVGVSPSLSGSVTNVVEVFGGGVSAPAVASAQNAVSTTPAAPGLDEFHLDMAGADGSVDTQAGDHPFGLTASFNFGAETADGLAQYGENYQHLGSGAVANLTDFPVREVKDVVVDLPPGFVGDPQDATQCPESALEPPRASGLTAGETECPASSEVGLIQTDTGGHIVGSSFGAGNGLFSPIYNMVPESGYPAEFGFNLGGHAIILYASAVPTPQGYVLRVGAFGIPQAVRISNIALTFWGVPAERVHNALRFNSHEEPVESGLQPLAFLTNPVDCSAGSLTATAMSDSWGEQGRWLADGSPDLSDPAWHVVSTVVYPQLTGCDLLQFTPAIEALPSTSEADEPAGLSVNLSVPQSSQLPPNLPTPEMKNVTVTLPAGLSLDPSAADGLQGCSPAQIALESALAGSCPSESVVGTDKIVTPLLASPLEGQVFLESPRCDPCSTADAADGNMIRLYLEARGSGVVIKKEGTVYVNTSTGQVTATFADNPQFPFSHLELHFKGGLRAPLATPQSCGTYMTTSDFTPWSSPITPDATPTSQFDVDWNGEGGACPSSPPLDPVFSAGTSNPDAGQFSPFTLTFSRQDREQDLAGIQVHMPPGLLGILTGVPLCGQPQASLGTCPAGSRIGTMTVAAGPGGHPFYTQGSLYLTGPYGGAPFGLSIVVPTVAGPFNLGNVVVRAKIDIDPITSALTVTTDALPQIIDGIPLRLRTANVTVDRPGFIYNPSNCSQMHVTATIAGAQGAQANVSAPFAVSGCAGLKFHPTFAVSTSGHTSRVNGASLDVQVHYPTGPQGSLTNIAAVKVELPKQLPARLTTLQKACPAATFAANPAGCPPASIVGAVRASTPLLPVPLAGPAYFVSHGGEQYPDLIMVLQGYGVRVDLVGSTFISKQGITSSTLKTVPDVPVGSFELYLPEGPYSALAANGNLCKSSLRMPVTLTGQNGAEIHESSKIAVTSCPKAKTKKARASKRKPGQAHGASYRHTGNGKGR